MRETEKRKSRRWLRILKRIVLVVIVLAVVLVYGVMPYLLARLVTGASTRPADRQLSTTPASLGAEFKDVEFRTADGVSISAWLLPSRGKQTTIIYSHGLFRSRREVLERAIDLWKRGYGALLYDSRNHGDSGEARVSLGYHERLDAAAAVRFLREEARTADRVVLFGISMGAVTALMAAAETPEVAAVISDSAFLSFEDTLAHHVRVFLRLPAFPLANEVQYFVERRAQFDATQLNAVEAVRRIGDRSIFFISGAHDRRMPPAVTEALYAAAGSERRQLAIAAGDETAIHGHAYQADPALDVDRIDRFLAAALR